MSPLSEARRSQTSGARLRALAESDDPAVREAVARHRNTPMAALGALVAVVPDLVFAHPRVARSDQWRAWGEGDWLAVITAPQPPPALIQWAVGAVGREVAAAAIASARWSLSPVGAAFARDGDLAAKLFRAHRWVAEHLGPRSGAFPPVEELVDRAVDAQPLRGLGSMLPAAAALVLAWLTGAHLLRLARVCGADVAVAVATHPNATAAVVQTVAQRHPSVGRDLHASPHVSPTFLLRADPEGADFRILRALVDRGEGYQEWIGRALSRTVPLYRNGRSPLDILVGAPRIEEVLGAFAAHPGSAQAVAAFCGPLTEAIHDRLVEQPVPEVRRWLAARSDLPPEVARRLVGDPQATVRERLATNAAVPWEIVAPLWHDWDSGVRWACRRRIDAPVSLLTEHIDRANVSDLLAMIPHPEFPQAQLQRLVLHPDTSVVCAVLRHRSYEPQDVAPLLVSPEVQVRRALATRSGLSTAALVELAQDPDRRVRRALLDRGDLMPEVLLQLCFDPSVQIRLAVAKRAGNTHEVLEVLADDDNVRVREAARPRLRGRRDRG